MGRVGDGGGSNSERRNLPSTILLGDQHCYVLELEIKDIVFAHHPLFCREHVLAIKLSQLHEKYEYRLQAAITKRLSCKLRALRTARINLNKIALTEHNADMKAVHHERLSKYVHIKHLGALSPASFTAQLLRQPSLIFRLP